MYDAISRSSVYVLDQDEALDFYTKTLGLELSTDLDLGFMRWLTVRVPGDPVREILLERPGPPSMDDATAAQVRELLTKGAVAGSLFLTTPDAQGTYETLKARGVEITDEPSTQALRHRLRDPRPVRQRHPHRADVRHRAQPGRADRPHRQLSGGGLVVPLPERHGRRPHRIVAVMVGRRRVGEPPAPSAPGDGLLVGVDAGSREHPAVIGTARARPVLVDGAPAVDQHRAVASLVVAEHDVAARAGAGAGNSSAAGMWASVADSSGSMRTNCDDVQHAVQPLQGTSLPPSPRSAACMPVSQIEKSPASRSGCSSASTIATQCTGVAARPSRCGRHGAAAVERSGAMERPLTVTEAAARLRAGEITSVELTRRCIDAADRLDGDLGTYIVRFDDEALAAAARADAELAAGTDRGPLHGIPVGMKDILAMAEGPTTAQSLVLDPAWGEGKDAPVVTRLKAGGAVITGKLTTMEFAVGFPDPDEAVPDTPEPMGRRHLARRLQLGHR